MAISTPLLNLLRQEGSGCSIVSPISGKEIKFVGYSFEDDTDLIQTPKAIGNPTKVIMDMQCSLSNWEVGLRATRGAIVPEKSYWYLTDFKWESSNGKYNFWVRPLGT